MDGAGCHAVHGIHDAAIHELEHDAHDDDGKSEEHREQLDEELRLIDEDLAHRDVGGDVSDGLALGILERLVHGEEPAVLVVGDNRIDCFALEELRQVGLERRVERDDRARVAAFFPVFRVEVEYHVAAVFQNLVHVQVHCLLEPVAYLVQVRLGFQVPFGVFALCDVFVYAVRVDCYCGGFGKTMRDVGELAYRYLAVQHESGDACERTQEDFGDDDDDDDFAQERTLDLVVAELVRVFGEVRVEQEDVAVEVLQLEREQPVRDDGDGDDDGLVDDVEDEVGRKLREELGESKVVVDGERERRGDAFAEIVAVEEVSEDGTEYAA